MNRQEKKHIPVIDMTATAARLRELRLKQGLSVREVADRLCLTSLDSIYHWENAHALPKVENLYALSQLYQVPMDQLLVSEA